MQVAIRTTHEQLSLRALVVIAGSALMIIVGLLGMHTFSTNMEGHDTHHSEARATAAATAVDQPNPMQVGAEAASTAQCDHACAMGTEPGHSGMVTACVLALFAGLLLLIRPMRLKYLEPHLLAKLRSMSLQTEGALPRPPSLIFLSISRT